MKKKILLLIITTLLITGCASLKDTTKGIAHDPATYQNTSEAITREVNQDFPGVPYAASVGIGYALAFLRRWYKEIKKEQKKNISG